MFLFISLQHVRGERRMEEKTGEQRQGWEGVGERWDLYSQELFSTSLFPPLPCTLVVW